MSSCKSIPSLSQENTRATLRNGTARAGAAAVCDADEGRALGQREAKTCFGVPSEGTARFQNTVQIADES